MITDSGITVCDTCGQELGVGEYPFCPHGLSGTAAFRDDIPGGLTVENYGPHPITFYSHTERRAHMKAHGLQEKETFCPMPGTDIDPAGIPNPAGFVDPQTLANGIALITRAQKIQEFDGIKSGVLRDLSVETIANAEEMKRALGQS